MKKCPYCGVLINENSIFCTKCGKPIPQDKICPDCGASMDPNNQFCPNCGKHYNKAMATPRSNHNQTFKKPNRSSSQWQVLIPVILVLFFIVLTILGGIWYYQKIIKKTPLISEETIDSIIEVVDSAVQTEIYPDYQFDDDLADLEEYKSDDHLQETNTAIGAFNNSDNEEIDNSIVSDITKNENVSSSRVFDVVDEMPQYPGGPSSLFEYLSMNIKYPVVAEENGVQGRVIVTFIVERDGSITDVRVVKSVDPSLDKEAIRVINNMPKWQPGKQNGIPVRVKYTVPVTFKLQ